MDKPLHLELDIIISDINNTLGESLKNNLLPLIKKIGEAEDTLNILNNILNSFPEYKQLQMKYLALIEDYNNVMEENRILKNREKTDQSDKSNRLDIIITDKNIKEAIKIVELYKEVNIDINSSNNNSKLGEIKTSEVSDKEESDREDSDREDSDREDSDREDSDKEASDKEEKEESDKEASNKEESDKEESDKEESDREEKEASDREEKEASDKKEKDESDREESDREESDRDEIKVKIELTEAEDELHEKQEKESDGEERHEQEESDVEREEEEEEEEEVEEITINGKKYFTTNEINGEIYENDNDEPGDQVAYYKDKVIIWLDKK